MSAGKFGDIAAETGLDLKLFTDRTEYQYAPLMYEGLPPELANADVFHFERERVQTVELDGYSFYAELLQLQPSDAMELAALLGEQRSFRPYQPDKRCDFHPDYALEWLRVNSASRAHICLTCHEVRAFGPAGLVHCDIADEAYGQFRTLLIPYRKNRPVVVYELEDDAVRKAWSQYTVTLDLPLLRQVSGPLVGFGVRWSGTQLLQVLDELNTLDLDRGQDGLDWMIDTGVSDWSKELKSAATTAAQCGVSVIIRPG